MSEQRTTRAREGKKDSLQAALLSANKIKAEKCLPPVFANSGHAQGSWAGVVGCGWDSFGGSGIEHVD